VNGRGRGITQGLRVKTMVFTSRQMKTSLRKVLLGFTGVYIEDERSHD